MKLAIVCSHYDVIADALVELPDQPSRIVVIYRFARLFARDNDRFDPERFLAACGLRAEPRGGDDPAST